MRLSIKEILDCKLITIDPYVDSRGFFYESFNHEIAEIVGFRPVQESMSMSHKNVVRGLHIQHTPPAAKLVRVLSGRIQDVVVDCRKGISYGRHASIVLDQTMTGWFFVPVGYAHGFCALQDNTVVNYYVSAMYNPLGEISIDPYSIDLPISWQVTKEEAIQSDKDRNSVDFRDLKI